MKIKVFKCPKCQRKFVDNGKSGAIVIHLRKTCKISKKESLIMLIKFRYNLSQNKIKTICQEYFKGASLPELRNSYGLPIKTLSKIINHFGSTRNLKESANSPNTRNKYKKTCLERYGVKNISQLPEIQKKKEQTFYKNYGVKNIFQSEEFKAYLNWIMIQKYGVKRIIPQIQAYWKPKTEELFKSYLTRNNISFIHSFFIKERQYDFLLPTFNLIVEINGDFFHANPLFYKADDVLPIPGGSLSAKEIWKRDKQKKEIAIASGYKILYIWETDLKNKKEKQILSMVKQHGNQKNQVN